MTPVHQPPDLPSDLPPAVVVYIRALEATITTLQAKITELEARLNQNSWNASKPPSSDPPGVKPAPPKGPSGTRRGGQPGHPKAERTRLPPDEIRTLRPSTCRGCVHPLTGDDPNPAVHQMHEIPVIRPHVVEYRCHRLRCPRCGATTVAPVPTDAVTGYGPAPKRWPPSFTQYATVTPFRPLPQSGVRRRVPTPSFRRATRSGRPAYQAKGGPSGAGRWSARARARPVRG